MIRPYKYLNIRQQNFILMNYDIYKNRELSEILNCTEGAVRSCYRRFGFRKVAGNGCFKKKNNPWDKGKKGLKLGGETKFKKGHIPAQTKPVGSMRINKDGILEIKYSLHKWRSFHSHLFIEKYGELPVGKVVIFKKEADKLKFTAEDLLLVSRAELLKLNNKR